MSSKRLSGWFPNHLFVYFWICLATSSIWRASYFFHEDIKHKFSIKIYKVNIEMYFFYLSFFCMFLVEKSAIFFEVQSIIILLSNVILVKISHSCSITTVRNLIIRSEIKIWAKVSSWQLGKEHKKFVKVNISKA